VSTMPTTFDAALEPSHAVRNARGELRASFDMDDFSAGFGIWSGTSFAAPVFAGQLAARLAGEYAAGRTDLGRDASVDRMRRLLRTMPGRRRPAAKQSAAEKTATKRTAAKTATKKTATKKTSARKTTGTAARTGGAR
jgi:subtilisin family serine protease